jgi:small subunit ribosomal protein S17
MSETETKSRGLRKERRGIVVSKSGDKSIVVNVERRTQHPLYRKVMRQFKKLHAHDEKNEAKVGDNVVIVEARPMSKLKRWRVKEVTQK